MSYICVKHMALFSHRAKNKKGQCNKGKALEVVRKKRGDNRLLLRGRG